jgi:HD superfamily phosphodiesterase
LADADFIVEIIAAKKAEAQGGIPETRPGRPLKSSDSYQDIASAIPYVLRDKPPL